MAMTDEYAAVEPSREEIDRTSGALVLEFGSPWCGYCRRAQPLIAEAFATYEDVRHIKIEDGPGRRLGRSYRIKLWPTLVFLRDGVEVARTVRPVEQTEIAEGLAQITTRD